MTETTKLRIWGATIALMLAACGGSSELQGEQVDAGPSSGSGSGSGSGCEIDNSHHSTGEVDLLNACEVCDPSESTTSWTTSSDGTACETGGECIHGQCTCPAGTIVCGNSCVDPGINGNCGACGVTCSGADTCYENSCTEVPTQMPTPRSSLTVTGAPNGLIYALGGFNGGNLFTGFVYSTVEIYSPAANTWTTGTPMPTPRNEHATAVDAGHLYTLGGNSGELAPPLASLDIYNIATDTWTTGAPMPTARMSLCAVTGSNGKIYAIGGGNEGYPDGTYIYSNVVEIYTPSTNTWTTGAAMPTAREDLSCAVGADGRIYAMGGVGNAGETAVVEAYNLTTNTWTTAAPLPVTLRQFAAVTHPNGKIYALGGMSDFQYRAEVYTYETSTNTWTLDSGLSTPRNLFGAAVGASTLFAIGGYNGGVLSMVSTYTSIGSWIP